MESIVEMLQSGGAAVWPILATPALALPVLIVLAVLALLRFRVPAALWVLPPVGALLTGHLGVAWGVGTVQEALAFASTSMKPALASMGLSEVLVSRLLGQGSAATLFLAAAFLAAASNLRAGERPIWTWRHALAPAALGVAAAAASVPAALAFGGSGVALAGVGLVGGVALAAASLRLDEDPAHAARMAAARGTVAALAFAAAVTVFAVELTWGRIDAYRGIAMSDPAVRAVLQRAAFVWYPWALAPGAALIGLAGAAAVGPAARHLDRRAFVGAALAAVALLVPVLVRIAIDAWASGLTAMVRAPWPS